MFLYPLLIATTSLTLSSCINHPFVSFNGMFNNPSNLDWGSTGTPLAQPLRPDYKDGAGVPQDTKRDSARAISLALFPADDYDPPSDKFTALLPYFSQFVEADVLDMHQISCPPEHLDIQILDDDPVFRNKSDFKESWMPLDRARYVLESGKWGDYPRVQINSATSWLDASQIYGLSKGWNDIMRSGKDGSLLNVSGYPMSNKWKLPLRNRLKPASCQYNRDEELHVFGNPGANENPGLYSLQWLFFNEHNRQAAELKLQNPGMNDKWLFDKARRLTITRFQNIVINEWLPTLLGDNIPDYTAYNPGKNPAISFLYAGAVRFYFLTLVPDQIFIHEHGKTCTVANGTIRPCNYYWDGQRLAETFGASNILYGMTYQPASKLDMKIVEDVQSDYYGPMHYTRRDGIALAIQTGRDLGVPSLNTVLRYFGKDAMSWDDWRTHLNDPKVYGSLRSLYSNSVEAIELFVGGMLLSKKGQLSDIFKLILREQFLTLRDSDRFWFENEYNGCNFTAEEIADVRKTTIASVFASNGIDVSRLKSTNLFVLDKLAKECAYDRVKDRDNLPTCAGDVMTHYNYNTTPYAIPILFPTLLVFTLLLVLLLRYLVNQRSRSSSKPPKIAEEDVEENASRYGQVYELQTLEGDRLIEVEMDKFQQAFITRNTKGRVLRKIPWTSLKTVPIAWCSNNPKLLLISIPKEYDIFLKFMDEDSREVFIMDLKTFNEDLNIKYTVTGLQSKQIMKVAKTETHRQHMVETFLSAIFSEMMRKDNDILDNDNMNSTIEDKVDSLNLKGVGTNVLECELTRAEFANAMGLRPEQEFVDKIFPLVDRDRNGRISFREFLSFMVMYSSGTSEDKLKLIFNMYDVDKSGTLHIDEIKHMIKSMLEMVKASIGQTELEDLIGSLLQQAGFVEKAELSFEEFTIVMAGYRKDIENAKLNVHGTTPASDKKRETHLTISQVRRKKLKRYIENNRLEVFWGILFFLVCAILFVERFVTYRVYRYHTGMPQLLGYGLAISRGSAAVVMFTFPLLLVLMCKNTLTHLRATFLKRYLPLDSNRHAHIIVGFVSLVFSVGHCCGHGYNFYMISTLSPEHLACLMPKTWFDGHSTPATITSLLFGTITGVTGLLLVVVLLIMYVFSTQYARQRLFNVFWRTHQLYPVVMALLLLHGTARLLQEPTFQFYLIGPALLFTFDKLISISRKRREIPLLEANILPSEVTHLKFKRPADFSYMAGQYAEIALVNAGRDEYHPFTLTSAPHEDYLSMHIRTCRGWTKLLRELCIKHQKNPERLPNVYVNGPFGEAHQDYQNYEVVILIGGGIGVTPFASIIKDLVHKSQSAQSNLSKVKKVYFLWSTRTQKQFEWLIDIIGKCEEEDTKGLLDTHIFITQFYQKLDLRTTMLYICEKHFQGISNRSLFTGLKAITHFGRPDFDKVFSQIGSDHRFTRKFGVFVCGPPAMSDCVKRSCANFTGKQSFNAYAENF